MKKLIIVILCSITLGTYAQVGNLFPELKGIDLNDKRLTIPNDCKGKQAIICIAYSKRAEEALRGWLNPIYDQFIAKTGFMDDAYDVNVFFIPMFTGVLQPTEKMALKQLKDGTGKEYFGNIICYHGSMRPFKDALNIDEKEFPYFFLLDKDGKIIYTTKGFYSAKKMEEIADKLE